MTMEHMANLESMFGGLAILEDIAAHTEKILALKVDWPPPDAQDNSISSIVFLRS